MLLSPYRYASQIFKVKVEIPNKFEANTEIKFFEFRAKRAAIGVTLE